ncbi:MAG: ParB N-terminal domain-containing protein [Alphaproteobacteria bacterium]|nr:ParB N-terminal domain-containing protein [Alphaproteobacteria bacterium]
MNSRLAVEEIAIADIAIGDRKRPATAVKVEALSADIAERGLRQPIEVGRQDGDTPYRLVSGLHRLTACTSLGWETIPAVVLTGDDLTYRRDELLENLARNELSKLERAQFVSELKAVHLALNPEAAHGGDRRSAEFQEGKIPSWSAAAAGRTGWTEATLKKAVQIGERLDGAAADALRGSAIEDNQKELERLSKFGPEIQRRLAGLIRAGEAKTVGGAHKRLSGAPAADAAAPETSALQRALDAFARLSKRDQRAFVEELVETGFGNGAGQALCWIDEPEEEEAA